MNRIHTCIKALSSIVLVCFLSFHNLVAQVAVETNTPLIDPANDTETSLGKVSFYIEGGVSGDFQSNGDIDFFDIDQIAADADFEIEVIAPAGGFQGGSSTAAPGYDIRLYEYSNAARTIGVSNIPVTHGNEYSLNAASYYSISLEQTNTAVTSYVLALVEGDGTLNNAAFPVEWLSFEVNSVALGVELIWSTASEENNQGFYIERSLDAQTWESLDFVEGAGTTQEIQTYTYTDRRPNMGYSYYRLKQIDFNGDFEYSEIREITMGVEASSSSIQVFPNPVKDQLILSPFVGKISLLDLSGRILFQEKQNGTWKSQDVSDLPSGAYILHIQPVNDKSVSFTLLKY